MAPLNGFEDCNCAGLQDFNFKSETAHSDAVFHVFPLLIPKQLNNIDAWIEENEKRANTIENQEEGT